MADENKKQKIKPDGVDAARLVEIVRQVEHINKKKLYLNNFLRGIFFGAGSVLGATIVIGLVVWILSLLDTVPLIGPLIENTTETIKNSR